VYGRLRAASGRWHDGVGGSGPHRSSYGVRIEFQILGIGFQILGTFVLNTFLLKNLIVFKSADAASESFAHVFFF
jgi:hypothetical protein